MIERRRQRNHAARADPSIGGLEADDTAQRRRLADGAGCVGANGAVAESGGDRGGRTSRRPAGDVRQIPGIVNRAVISDHRTAAVGELVQILLAEQHGAGVAAGGARLRHPRGECGLGTPRCPRSSGRRRCRSDLLRPGECHAADRANPRARFPLRRGGLASSAESEVTVMKAWIAGSSRAMRARQSFVSSTGDSDRLRNRSPSSRIELCKSRPFFKLRVAKLLPALPKKKGQSLMMPDSPNRSRRSFEDIPRNHNHESPSRRS